MVCGNIYVGNGEATTALESPSGAQTLYMGQAASGLQVDKGKNRIESSSQVCVGAYIMFNQS